MLRRLDWRNGTKVVRKSTWHNGKDAKSHLVKHDIEKFHKQPEIENFNIIGKGYRNNTFKWKVAKSLLIKDVRPNLNTHEKSMPLKLFNWYEIFLFPLSCE